MTTRLDLRPPYNALLLVSGNRVDASDRSNYARTPTVGSGVTFPSRVLDFDGSSNAYVTYPDAAELEAVPLSVFCWIRIDTYTGVRQIVGKCTTSGTYEGWVFYYGPGLSRGLSLLQIDSPIPVTTGYAAHWTATASLASATWYHVGFTLASLGATPVFYINGVATAVAGSAVLGSVVSFANSTPLKLGGLGSPDVTSYHDGALDDIYACNTVLTASEVYNLYINGSGVTRT